MHQARQVYTVNTLEELLKKYTDVDFYFMLGIDAFLDIPNWREPEKIISLTNFIVLSSREMLLRNCLVHLSGH